jgi:hypothetical protein
MKLNKLNYIFIKSSPLLALPHPHLSRTRLTPSTDASVRCPLQTYFHLNVSPYYSCYISPTVSEYTLSYHIKLVPANLMNDCIKMIGYNIYIYIFFFFSPSTPPGVGFCESAGTRRTSPTFQALTS